MPNRLLTINLRNYMVKQPRRKRPARMTRYVRLRIAKSTNIKSGNIKISQELNSIMLKRHLHSMMPLKVNISIDKEKAMVTSFSEKSQTAPSTTAGKPAAQPDKKPESSSKAAKPIPAATPKQQAGKYAAKKAPDSKDSKSP